MAPLFPSRCTLAIAILASLAVLTLLPSQTGAEADFRGFEDTPLALDVTVDPGGPVDRYLWDFEGDGTFDWNSTEGPDTVHTYWTNDTFYAILRAELSNGTHVDWIFEVLVEPTDQPPIVSIAKGSEGYLDVSTSDSLYFSATAVDPDGSVVLYQWDFDGDGVVDFSSQYTADANWVYARPGMYNATLRVVDDAGNAATDTVVVYARNSPPTVSRPPDLTTDDPNVTLHVTANDPDGEIASYAWTFGDGTPGEVTAGPSVTHTFEGPGRYLVTVNVTDSDGGSTTASWYVEVVERGGDEPPSVDAGRDRQAVVDRAVLLEANVTAGSNPVAWVRWDLDGDGDLEAEGVVQTYIFSVPGTRVLRVRVEDTAGLSAEDSVTVVVHPEENIPPVPVPSVEQWVKPGRNLRFSEESYDPDGTIVMYKWDFDGDGRFDFASSVSGNHTWVYPEEDLYQAVLEVTDNRGEVNSTSVTIKVSWDAPGDEGEVDDTMGAAVCCASMTVVLILVTYWTLRRSMATPRKDGARGGGPEGGPVGGDGAGDDTGDGTEGHAGGGTGNEPPAGPEPD